MREKIRKAAYAAWIAGSLALTGGVSAYADNGLGALTDGLTGGLGQIYNVLLAVALPIGVVALGVCGVKILWGSQRSAEEGKSAIVRIVIALTIVFLAPIIISTIKSWIKPSDSSAASEIFGSGYSAG